MGSLKLPVSGVVYIDSVTLIYSVEQYPGYGPLIEPLWQAAQNGTVEVISSELLILETLVGPLKSGDVALQQKFEGALQSQDLKLWPITQLVLREAARLRALTKLRTPDAIHAATALVAGAALFITNDKGFKGTSGLPLVILDDLLP